MRALGLYDAGLIELNKVHAPSMLLDDYNYFINKAIQQYANLAYARLELNQQCTDDIRSLKRSKTYVGDSILESTDGYCAHYKVKLPENYFHLANCIIKYESNDENVCTGEKDLKSFPVRRLSVDLLPSIVNNAYMKPKYNRPYYAILDNGNSLDSDKQGDVENYLDIYVGDGLSGYNPTIYIEYIKTPDIVKLTFDDIQKDDNDPDDTQVLEFPDYVCYEIVNIFVRLVMENASNPRLRTNIPINNTIGGSDES